MTGLKAPQCVFFFVFSFPSFPMRSERLLQHLFFAVSQIGFELFKKGSGDVTIALPFSLPLAIML